MTREWAAFALAMVVGALLAETRLSMRNETALRARGAVEPRGDTYAALAVIYPLAFLLMGAEGLWRASAPGQAVVARSVSPAWWVAGVLLMVASKGLKYWAIAHLADRWTFRILVLPGAALVRTGPYRHVDHPNYVAVFGELVGMMLMMSAWIAGPLMTLAFGAALGPRLRVESRALRDPVPR